MNCKITYRITYEMNCKINCKKLEYTLVSLILLLPTLSLYPLVTSQAAPPGELYAEIGDIYNVDPHLLKAIARVESGEYPKTINLDDPSFGLMQVLCEPNKKGVCTNRLPAVRGWEGMTVERLLDPRANLMVAAQILKWNLKHYGYPRGIAVYNCWSARKDPVDGPFRNQEYVDKVRHELTKMETQPNEQAQQN